MAELVDITYVLVDSLPITVVTTSFVFVGEVEEGPSVSTVVAGVVCRVLVAVVEVYGVVSATVEVIVDDKELEEVVASAVVVVSCVVGEEVVGEEEEEEVGCSTEDDVEGEELVEVGSEVSVLIVPCNEEGVVIRIQPSHEKSGFH
ncbi:hypothetical protein OGATHE_005235 [Ogataea polymorpha]|uniref:Uncharacterized protein n=1 Tax=Ogataea polymorpha TaxID=460523 RepID=A0A9P8SZN2_9ASCO|nr:hypothetical protein OGATHE_005235 [Ogataea polymorpha]